MSQIKAHPLVSIVPYSHWPHLCWVGGWDPHHQPKKDILNQTLNLKTMFGGVGQKWNYFIAQVKFSPPGKLLCSIYQPHSHKYSLSPKSKASHIAFWIQSSFLLTGTLSLFYFFSAFIFKLKIFPCCNFFFSYVISQIYYDFPVR